MRKMRKNPELVVVYNPGGKRKGQSMARRRRKRARARNPRLKLRARIGGKNRNYRSYVKYYVSKWKKRSPKRKGALAAARASWRKSTKQVRRGKTVYKCRAKSRNPRGRKASGMSRWQCLVSQYGVKGAKSRYGKRRKGGRKKKAKRSRR